MKQYCGPSTGLTNQGYKGKNEIDLKELVPYWGEASITVLEISQFVVF